MGSLAESYMTINEGVEVSYNGSGSGTRGGFEKIIAAEPTEGEYALDLLMIAKYFERIGDHCTNIAEWVVFFATGEHKSCQ